MPVRVSFEEPSRFLLEVTGRITGAESSDAFEKVLSHPRFHRGVTLLAVTHDVTGAPPTDERREIAASALADLADVQVEVFLDVNEARNRLDEIATRAA